MFETFTEYGNLIFDKTGKIVGFEETDDCPTALRLVDYDDPYIREPKVLEERFVLLGKDYKLGDVILGLFLDKGGYDREFLTETPDNFTSCIQHYKGMNIIAIKDDGYPDFTKCLEV